MKIQKVANGVIACVLTIFFTMASSSPAGQQKNHETTAREVSQEVKEAIESIENYSEDKRDEALKKVKMVIHDLDARIDGLEDQAAKRWDRMDQAAREKARSTLKSLRKKRNKLAEWYGGMQHSSTKAWQHVKKGFLESYEALSEAYAKAVKEF